MLIVSSPAEVRALVESWRRDPLARGRIALVPTMGALHDGHLRLVERARELASKVIVSIFVNPMQFAPNEDLAKYPRPFEEDRRKCEAAGVDLLFHPGVGEMYPEGFRSKVLVGGLTEPLEGQSRPGHFDGVATVCLKLFQISGADLAVFGEKDFQQLRVLQQMIQDLNLTIRIEPHAIVREADGLAISSRNRYLSPAEREWAARIPRALGEAERLAAKSSGVSVGECLSAARKVLNEAPLKMDYLAIASSQDLRPLAESVLLATVKQPRLLVAVKAGTTRLIDNIALEKG